VAVQVEQDRVAALFSRVEQIEDVANTLAADDPRRRTLSYVVRQELSAAEAVRPVIAAALLGLTEKTVRTWVHEGVLTARTERPRLLLDPSRLHDVWHLVRELEAAGQHRGLLEELYHRLADAALLEREDLQASLEQMRRGEGHQVAAAEALAIKDDPVDLLEIRAIQQDMATLHER